MARCCAEGKCYCSVVEGTGISVTGTGFANNPFVISATGGGGGGGDGGIAIEDLPPLVTWVDYDAVDGWPTRPDIPVGWKVLWINAVDDTMPPSGVGGAISGLDNALVALPIP